MQAGNAFSVGFQIVSFVSSTPRWKPATVSSTLLTLLIQTVKSASVIWLLFRYVVTPDKQMARQLRL